MRHASRVPLVEPVPTGISASRSRSDLRTRFVRANAIRPTAAS